MATIVSAYIDEFLREQTIAAADQATIRGLISAAESTVADPPRGCLYIDTTLTNTANGTPAKLEGAGSTTSVTLSADVDENSAENRLRYTGTTTRWFLVTATISTTHSVSNTVLTFSFAKNGTNIAGSSVNRKIGTGADEGALALSYAVSLATNDYVEIFSDADAAGTTSATAGTFTITPL